MSDNAETAAAAVTAPTPDTLAPAAEPVAPAQDVSPPPEPVAEVPAAAVVPAETQAEVAPAAEADGGLLSASTKPAETASSDVPTVEPAAPLEPVVYEAFTLPEGVSLNDEGVGKFKEVAGTHRLSQEAAQSLVDMHTSAMQQYAEHVAGEQQRVWTETRAGWRKEIMGDPDYGGAAFETNRAAAVRVLDMLVPQSEREAFNTALMATGMTDHPQFFKLLVRAASYLDEPAPRPQGAPPPRPQGNAGNRRNQLYTNPSSPR